MLQGQIWRNYLFIDFKVAAVEHTHLPNFWNLGLWFLLTMHCFSTYDQLALSRLEKAFGNHSLAQSFTVTLLH